MKSARQQLQQLEAMAQAELAQMEQMAASQPAARHSVEQASLEWDLGVDATDLALAPVGFPAATAAR